MKTLLPVEIEKSGTAKYTGQIQLLEYVIPHPPAPLYYGVSPRNGVSMCYGVTLCYGVSQCYNVMVLTSVVVLTRVRENLRRSRSLSAEGRSQAGS